MSLHPERVRYTPVPQGSFNELRVAIGRVGTGKSTLALEWADELSRQSYVLVHDPGYGFPEKLVGSDKVIVKRHSTVASAVRALHRNPGIQSVATADVMPLLNEAEKLADGNLRRARSPWRGGWNHKPGDKPSAVPVTVVIDEAILLLSTDKPAEVKRALRRAITTRRHHHLGLIFTIQQSNLFDYQFLNLASCVGVFRVTDDWGVDKLRGAGMPREAREELTSLDQYEYVLWWPGTGIKEREDRWELRKTGTRIQSPA